MTTCENCKYGAAKFTDHLRECRRHAPVLITDPYNDGRTGVHETRWPVVSQYHWCGDWESLI